MFSDIDMRRDLAGIQQKALCKRAGIHPTRYSARKNGRSGMSETTLKKLQDALAEMIAERRSAMDGADAGGVR